MSAHYGNVLHLLNKDRKHTQIHDTCTCITFLPLSLFSSPSSVPLSFLFPSLFPTFSFPIIKIGIGKDQTYRIFLALKQLTTQQPLASVRFWGIIFGIEASYIIAEGEYQDGHEEEEEEEEEEAKQDDQEGDGEGKDNEDEIEEKDVLPESQWKPPPVIPKEETRTGTNKKIYFVCNTRKLTSRINVIMILIIITKQKIKIFEYIILCALLPYAMLTCFQVHVWYIDAYT